MNAIGECGFPPIPTQNTSRAVNLPDAYYIGEVLFRNITLKPSIHDGVYPRDPALLGQPSESHENLLCRLGSLEFDHVVNCGWRDLQGGLRFRSFPELFSEPIRIPVGIDHPL